MEPARRVPPLTVPFAARVFGERLRRELGERVVAVRLFGSHARGEASEESDIDVLVLVKDLTHSEKVRAIEIGAEVSLETSTWLSPLVMDAAAFVELIRLETRLALDIEREGAPL